MSCKLDVHSIRSVRLLIRPEIWPGVPAVDRSNAAKVYEAQLTSQTEHDGKLSITSSSFSLRRVRSSSDEDAAWETVPDTPVFACPGEDVRALSSGIRKLLDMSKDFEPDTGRSPEAARGQGDNQHP